MKHLISWEWVKSDTQQVEQNQIWNDLYETRQAALNDTQQAEQNQVRNALHDSLHSVQNQASNNTEQDQPEYHNIMTTWKQSS